MTSNFANLKDNRTDETLRQNYVTELFDNLAPNYDRFNRWVSFFRDGHWRRETIRLIEDRSQGVILDLASGTGDLARNAAKSGARQVHVFDISNQMLQFAKKKLSRNSIESKVVYEQGSANALPFADKSFDGVVSGFAMRNVFHFMETVLKEIHRVLKPGGRFAILELSQPENGLVRKVFQFNMKNLVPLIGKATSGQSVPFDYLYETTMTFLSAEQFKQLLEKVGFREVSWKKYLFGGIAIHYGFRSET